VKCGCKSSCEKDDKGARDTALDLLEPIGWRDIGQRTLDIYPVIARSHRYLRKAERAEALGLGSEVASLHRRAAERENRQARRLIRSAQEGLRNRVRQEDWQQVSRQLDEAYREQGGEEAFQDMRARLIEWLYEEPDIPGDATSEAIEAIDQTTAAAQQGMESLVRNFDELLSTALAQRDDPDMGRTISSPQLSQAQLNCLQAMAILFALISLACLLSPFCWCCQGLVIFFAYTAAIAFCLFIVPRV
jgi:hypothetical protein